MKKVKITSILNHQANHLLKGLLVMGITSIAGIAHAQFPAPYCGPMTFTSGVEPITLVSFAGINNTSSAATGGTAHEDYLAQTGTVYQGTLSSITLKGNTDGDFTDVFRVYVDWNQNNNFTDAGESYDIGSITNSTGTDAVEVSGPITVPATATLGSTRMRVVKRYSTYPSGPCQTGSGYGQAEDYTLSVLPAPCTAPSATYSIIPDCGNNQYSISVNLTSMGSATSVAITNGTTTYATATGTGTYTAGPFTSNSPNTINLVHNLNSLCNSVSGPLNYNCALPNDLCGNAIGLTPAAACNPVPGTTVGATPGGNSDCQSLDNGDVWFSFTATGVSHLLTMDNISTTTAAYYGYGIAAYSGTCNGLAEIGCNSDFVDALSTPDPLTLVVSGLTVGQQVYVRVWDDEAYDDFFTDMVSDINFQICVTELAPPPPCATNVSPASGSTDVDLASAFTWDAVSGATDYEFYLGEGAGAPVSLGTTDLTSVTIDGLDFNTTYAWYVVPISASGSPTGCDANATTFTTMAEPAGASCSTPIAVNASPYTYTGNTASFGDFYYDGAPGTTCGTTSSYLNGSDVVFAYTASADGAIDINLTNLDNTYAGMFVYGSCADIGVTCLAGATNGDATSDMSIAAFPVVANTTYFVVVSTWATPQRVGFTLGITGTAPLPVTMEALNGKLLSGNLAELSWATASEQNNKGFDIQRSADGKNFITVGYVGSQAENGNSNRKLEYSFIDKDAVNGSAFYRLLQVDRDGKTSLSNVVRLSAKEGNAFSITAVPNPVADKLTLNTAGVQGGHAVLTVSDVTGKVVRTVTVSGSNTVIDMAGLSRGMYLIRYVDDLHNESIKVSKQ